jgi:hypothetical protein
LRGHTPRPARTIKASTSPFGLPLYCENAPQSVAEWFQLGSLIVGSRWSVLLVKYVRCTRVTSQEATRRFAPSTLQLLFLHTAQEMRHFHSLIRCVHQASHAYNTSWLKDERAALPGCPFRNLSPSDWFCREKISKISSTILSDPSRTSQEQTLWKSSISMRMGVWMVNTSAA